MLHEISLIEVSTFGEPGATARDGVRGARAPINTCNALFILFIINLVLVGLSYAGVAS